MAVALPQALGGGVQGFVEIRRIKTVSEFVRPCRFRRQNGSFSRSIALDFGKQVCRKRCSRGKQIQILSALASEVEEKQPDIEADAEITATGVEKWLIKAERAFNVFATEAVIRILDGLYADRLFARFYVLETIARVPYFAFVSVLHMYESFGWWRRADYLKVHFAESWNELHHLLVMEALGGDKRWVDRFLAQHIAVAYYFLTALMYLVSPRMAYHFSECVERHAYHTYDEFINTYGEELKVLPAPKVAVQYYTQGDLYMFDEFQTDRVPESRRPKVDNLYDVFVNIREDEAQHCKTMNACQTRGNLRSPHGQYSSGDTLKEDNLANLEQELLQPAECAGVLECLVTASSFADRAEKRGLEIRSPIESGRGLGNQRLEYQKDKL